MAFVKARDKEGIESLLRRFKKQVDNEGIVSEFKSRQYFVKPSLAKHEKNRSIEHKRNKETLSPKRKN